MTILFMLIPLAIVLMGTAVTALLWALREGQFDDLDSPGVQLILDDDRAPRASGADHGSARDVRANDTGSAPSPPAVRDAGARS